MPKIYDQECANIFTLLPEDFPFFLHAFDARARITEDFRGRHRSLARSLARV